MSMLLAAFAKSVTIDASTQTNNKQAVVFCVAGIAQQN